MKVKIYKLIDPRDLNHTPRYIGITIKTLNRRLNSHISESRLNKITTHKINWIRKLLSENIKPTIELLQEVDTWEEACKLEQYWIKKFYNLDCKLTNGTLGGEGVLGLKKENPLKGIEHQSYNPFIDREYVLMCYMLGDSATAIAKNYSISHTTVYRIVKSYGVEIRKRKDYGTKLLQYNLQGDFIKEWKNSVEVYKFFKSTMSGKEYLLKTFYKGYFWKEYEEDYPIKISVQNKKKRRSKNYTVITKINELSI